MNIKGAIFDLDGTILDSMYIWDNVGMDFLKNRGITPNLNLNETFRSMSLLQAAEFFRSNYGMIDSVQKIMDDINKMIEHSYYDVILLKDGVQLFLNQLKQNGVKMCIATATDKYLVEASLKRNGILQYFEGIFTCTEVNAGKDRPDIYLRSLNLLGTKISETYVFEDALYAMQTAKKAGFPVVAVYDATAQKQTEEIIKLADIYLNSFDEWSMKVLTFPQ